MYSCFIAVVAVVYCFKGDVTNEADVTRIVSTTVKEFGKLDLLINSAGILKAGAIQVEQSL